MGVRLEDLTPSALVGGITGDGAVTIVAVRWIGSNALQLTYRTEDGRLDERLLYRDHEPRLTLAEAVRDYLAWANIVSQWSGATLDRNRRFRGSTTGCRHPKCKAAQYRRGLPSG